MLEKYILPREKTFLAFKKLHLLGERTIETLSTTLGSPFTIYAKIGDNYVFKESLLLQVAEDKNTIERTLLSPLYLPCSSLIHVKITSSIRTINTLSVQFGAETRGGRKLKLFQSDFQALRNGNLVDVLDMDKCYVFEIIADSTEYNLRAIHNTTDNKSIGLPSWLSL